MRLHAKYKGRPLKEFHKILLVIIITIICFTMACRTVRLPRHDYKWIPIEKIADRMSGEQKMIMESKGTPHAVWEKPFGIFMWVYCIHDVPKIHFDFDVHGRLMGEGFGGSKELCKKPPPKQPEGSEADE